MQNNAITISINHLSIFERTDNVSAWQNRRRLFFKPASGYGGRAAYRGDKLTKRVWQEIARGEYVAQALVPPSERNIKIDGDPQTLKMDLRNYVYAGMAQLVSARLYQGQTTNFRTLGGGFSVPDRRAGPLRLELA